MIIQSSNINYGLEQSFGLRNPCNSYCGEQALPVHNSVVFWPLRSTSGLNRNFKIIQVEIICQNRRIVHWIVQGILADCFECSARDNPIGFWYWWPCVLTTSVVWTALKKNKNKKEEEKRTKFRTFEFSTNSTLMISRVGDGDWICKHHILHVRALSFQPRTWS